ncbi:hypothetical protein [Ferrimonas balearica]|uniref:hypothetical protein n=1 Tax=Ferrimonas balearica TaxID=44012 RepID=UPI001C997906|nr:hypothetical protein [Ferrimonas balearica]MBY5992645.1 hypothetical protein [Ferrimonas balearica]
MRFLTIGALALRLGPDTGGRDKWSEFSNSVVFFQKAQANRERPQWPNKSEVFGVFAVCVMIMITISPPLGKELSVIQFQAVILAGDGKVRVTKSLVETALC